ncbi:MAG: response regulator transcription factor [Candidatus Hydrogenedentes bacterium]|nr:response regulator transcription factor [Candidatus Hydrogenedentota bacterium]
MTKPLKSKILIVDDDSKLLRAVQTHLEKLGYEVATAADGRSALAAAKSMAFDLVVLDINFPDITTKKERSLDGIEVLRTLRDSDSVPILMLSSTNISAVKVMTLALGADDYVSKPFDLQELGARVEAILRRSRDVVQADKTLSFRRLRLDPGERRVWKDDVPIDLTGVEFDLLYTLARRPEHVFTREKLLEFAWKDSSCSIPKVVDVHIGHIRKKIEDDPSAPSFIITVRGTGYRFEDTPA